MGWFEKKKIDSFESVFWRVSGMRGAREYEIERRGGEAGITEYAMRCASGGGMERQPERQAVCPYDQLLELLNACGVLKWDGFCGKRPAGVLDGQTFTFRAVVNDGEEIRANGSENFPKHFREFCDKVNDLLCGENK
ncbi:MAG: hypothetical protein J6Z38_04550 [Lachnospiraceae bacterium]|nr:hypothetical protein [Lachnospiraceae bacterium]